MDFNQMMSSKKRLLFLLLQAVVLILCIMYIQSVYTANILPDKYISQTYEATNCSVLDKKLEARGHLLQRYRARFQVSHKQGGETYQSVTFGNGLDKNFSTDRASQEDMLDQFQVGATYPCWFNPKAPKQTVLVLRHNWESIFSLLMPFIIALITLYFFIRTVFKFCRRKTFK